MDSFDVSSEISAQSKLVDSISLDQAKVTEIDRHIKDTEKQLNDRFVHISVGQIIMHFLPPHPLSLRATRVTDDIWKSLKFTTVWPSKRNMHEEIAYDKFGKGFAFFYTKGEVLYDMAFVEDQGGADAYVRVLEDKRETVRVVGAPVEIKLRAFLNMRELVREINKRAGNVTSRYIEDVQSRYAKFENINGNR